MSAGELFLTLLVALFVFGPSKLPMLAYHLGQLMAKINQMKAQTASFWQAEANKHQLQKNIQKAQGADAEYLKEENH